MRWPGSRAGPRRRHHGVKGRRIGKWLATKAGPEYFSDPVSLIRGRSRTGGRAEARDKGPIPAWSRRRPRDWRRPSPCAQRRRRYRHTEHHEAERQKMLEPIEEILFQPASAFRIVHVVARHAREASEVHREEQHVGVDEGDQKSAGRSSPGSCSRHLREPIVPAGEDAEDGAQRQHIVEVRDDVIGVLQGRSTPAFASTTPVTPPTVNRKMKPTAQTIGAVKRIEPPHIVAIQENIFRLSAPR